MSHRFIGMCNTLFYKASQNVRLVLNGLRLVENKSPPWGTIYSSTKLYTAIHCYIKIRRFSLWIEATSFNIKVEENKKNLIDYKF